MNIERNVVSEKDIVSNIKGLALDMINKAGSGHPGIVLSSAPIMYTLFAHHLNVNLNDINWVNRDRFVMSAGHGSALLYATMFMAGYPLSIEDLKNFRRAGSKTPGHPEYGVTPGVDASTGPLGQGIAMAVGMALAGKINESKYLTKPSNRFDKNVKVFDHNVYVLCGDGDLMEGISSEAASLAGTLELNNLIVLYDSNRICLDGTTDHTFTENVRSRFESFGWNTIYVKDGESISDIDKAISTAKRSSKPTLIEIRTIIGKDSLLENSNEVHGKPLTNEDLIQLKRKLNLSDEPFAYSDFLRSEMIKRVNNHSSKKYDEWASEYKEIKDMAIYDFEYIFGRNNVIDLAKHNFNFGNDYKEELRNTNQEIMSVIANNLPNFIGGSADLASSTKVYLRDKKDISKDDYTGSNIWYGVREHAMGAIMNGLALSNFKTYGSTFLSFADYVKPAMRMSALMHLDPTYIFTHDSVSLGSDGPTHQPIEQLAMLRAMPNMNVFRPADANEIVGTWNYILNHNGTPSTIALSKNKVGLLNTQPNNVFYGGYIIKKEEKQLHGVIIATGTEVHTAILLADNLKESEGLDLRVVSMPCMELFLKQSDEYQKSVLPKGIRTIVIEAGSSFGWHQFVYNSSYLITIDNFGISGSKDEVLKYCQFDFESIKERIIDLLK